VGWTHFYGPYFHGTNGDPIRGFNTRWTRRLSVKRMAVVLFVLFTAVPIPAQQTQPLTNEDVVSLINSGLSSDVVLAKIKSSPCLFDTSVTGLRDLKSLGVPDPVILAMVQCPAAQNAGPVTPPTQAQAKAATDSLSESVQRPPNSSTTRAVNGWLVIVGGGETPNEAKERFVALAGGPDAKFVMIPTAMPDVEIPGRSSGSAKSMGIRNFTELHTRSRTMADSDVFVRPLQHASGVFIDGGRQWRLADAYLDTAVEREIKALLARGGVVLGSSAGASIQASFLVRGDSARPGLPDGDNRIMMSPGHEVGFGLLPNSAIDQHVDARGREADLDSVISELPELLGIGIDIPSR